MTDPGLAGYGKQMKAEWTGSAPTKSSGKDASLGAATAGAGAAEAGGFPGATDLPGAAVSVGSTAAMGAAAHTVRYTKLDSDVCSDADTCGLDEERDQEGRLQSH